MRPELSIALLHFWKVSGQAKGEELRIADDDIDISEFAKRLPPEERENFVEQAEDEFEEEESEEEESDSDNETIASWE